jgi:hypothetical protein
MRLIEECEAELAAQRAAAAADTDADAGQPSAWSERSECAATAWREHAAALAAAVLQQAAAPDPQQVCSQCQQQGCAVRYAFSCLGWTRLPCHSQAVKIVECLVLDPNQPSRWRIVGPWPCRPSVCVPVC